MTGHLLPIYGCAVLTISILGLFARANRKSGWTRQRATSMSEGLQNLYLNMGLLAEQSSPVAPSVWKAVSPEEAISFSAQMLKLRSALGASAPISQPVPATEEVLVGRG